MFRRYFGEDELVPLAEHHKEFWSWLWSIELGKGQGVIDGKPYRAFVGIWSRGGGKSTATELAVAAMGALGERKYCLYVCDSQDRANQHVGNIASALQSEGIEKWYPAAARRKLNLYGQAKGWRRNRLWTDSGFVVDALGLDVAARGVKVEDMRPDIIVLDDFDDVLDSNEVTQGKIETITKSIIPTGTTQTVFIVIQNLIRKGSVMHQLAGDAKFLGNRYVSGPHPAIRDMKLVQVGPREWKIEEGEATWEGQGIAVCEAMINEMMGPDAFNAECQHDIEATSDLVLPLLDRQLHSWPAGSYPDFEAYAGGLDSGGEGATAHFTAGLFAGLFRFPDDPEDVIRAVITSHFKKNGAGVAMLQRTWMRSQEIIWGGRKCAWRMDGSERTGVQLLRSNDEFDFDIVGSKRGRGVVEVQIGQISGLLATDHKGRPYLYIADDLVEVWADLLGWRRKPPNTVGEGRREPYDNDIGACLRYLAEQLSVSYGGVWSEEQQRAEVVI